MLKLRNLAVVDTEFVSNFLLPRLMRAGVRFEAVLRGLPRRGKPLPAINLLIDTINRPQLSPKDLINHQTVIILYKRTHSAKTLHQIKTNIIGIKLPQSIPNIIHTIKKALYSEHSPLPQNRLIQKYNLKDGVLILEEYLITTNSKPKIQYRLTYRDGKNPIHVPLTQNQMLILKNLLHGQNASPFSYISKTDILKDTTIKETSLPVLISQIRRKLRFFKIPLKINTFYGVGYILKSVS